MKLVQLSTKFVLATLFGQRVILNTRITEADNYQCDY